MIVSMAEESGRGMRAAESPKLLALLQRSPVAVLLGTLLVLALTLPKAIAVWRTGIFFNPDDAMRAVEVRDFMAGQAWFDLVPHRLSPLHPFSMHWSRLVDLMLAAMTEMFEVVTGPDRAERLMRLTEPVLLALLFLTILAKLGRDLVGRSGPLAVVLLAAGSLDLVSAFIPGHIHHHGLQQFLLIAIVKALCDGLDPARRNRMALAGFLAALSLGVNLQNMPFVAVAAFMLVLIWIRDGAGFDRRLRGFAAGLMVTGIAVFLAQVPPVSYVAPVCDAFAAPHLLAVGAGALSVLLLTLGSPLLRTRLRRVVGAALAGIGLLVLMKALYPACLGDPYAGVDPLLQTQWLAEVGEAMPLGRLLSRDPVGTFPIVAALALGLASTILAALRSRGIDRDRWLVLLLLCLVGIAGSLWEVRVAAATEALGLCGCAFVLCRCILPWRQGRSFAALLGFVAGLALTQAGWAAILPKALLLPGPRAGAAASGLPPIDPEACFGPSGFADLKALPPGLVLSTIDPGSQILAYTDHSVLAAAYQRNTFGNRVALLAFTAPLGQARDLIEDAEARYIALCTTSPEVHDFVRKAPDGFGARLLRGDLPPWLAALPRTAGPYRIFEVRSRP